MDLIPRNSIEPHHLNFDGWRTLQLLLLDTGMPIHGWSGTADGEVISEQTASDWGRTLLQCVGRGDLVVVEIPDRFYAEGVRSRIRVLAAQMRDPVPAVDSIHELMWLAVMMAAQQGLAVDPGSVVGESTIDPGLIVVRELHTDEEEWVRQFSAFCLASGGFEQC